MSHFKFYSAFVQTNYMTLHVNLPNGKSFKGVKKALNHAINQIG